MDNEYDVYIYNDLEGKYSTKLNMTLPAWIIGKTLAILLERKIQANDQSAEEIEDEIKTADVEGSFMSRFNQSLPFSDSGNQQQEIRRDSHTIESMRASFKMSSAVFLISGLRRWKKRASITLENEKRVSEAVGEWRHKSLKSHKDDTATVDIDNNWKLKEKIVFIYTIEVLLVPNNTEFIADLSIGTKKLEACVSIYVTEWESPDAG